MLKYITAAAVSLLLTSCTTRHRPGRSVQLSPHRADAAAQTRVDAAAPLSTSAARLAQSTADEERSSDPTIFAVPTGR